MTPRMRSRVVALFLAALFTGGVGGTSDLDALLFHRAAGAVGRAPHVEAASGCHAERCLLVFRLASGRVAPSLDLVVRFEGMPQHDAGARPAASPPRPDGAFPQQSRAPPAPSA
jgi:hypothetical protein